MLKSAYRKVRDAAVKSAIRLAPHWIAQINRARLGFPQEVYIKNCGIGDALLLTLVFRELKKRGRKNIVVRSRYLSLYQGNPDVDAVIREKNPLLAPLTIHGLNLVDLSCPRIMTDNYLAYPCRLVGITGSVELRPYLYLRQSELASGRLYKRQMVIQSSGLTANLPMQNKEWIPGRFQEVADRLQDQATLIQLGSLSDPLLKGVMDLRGKTSLRESASILANAQLFIGQVGFLMHLARAVDCRSVIVYGGRETPEQTGYIANKNLVGITPCSPCWEENKCDFDRECMKLVSVESVVKAAEEQIAQLGEPLKTEVFVI